MNTGIGAESPIVSGKDSLILRLNLISDGLVYIVSDKVLFY